MTTLKQQLASMTAERDALKARLEVARTLYRALRDSTQHTEHLAPSAKPSTMPVVTKYHDHLGREWTKTRIGNRSTSVLSIKEHEHA